MTTRPVQTLAELSFAELCEAAHRATGLAPPPRSADSDTWRQWYVAAMFLISAQAFRDAQAAAADAVACLREGLNFDKCIPFIETALGRPLTAAERGA